MAGHIGATMHLIEPTEQEPIDKLEMAMYHCEQPLNQLLGAGKISLSKALTESGFKACTVHVPFACFVSSSLRIRYGWC